MRSSQAVTVIVLGLSASLLLGACGKDDPGDVATASPSAAASSTNRRTLLISDFLSCVVTATVNSVDTSPR